MNKHRFIQLSVVLSMGFVLVVLTAAYTTLVIMQEDAFFDEECQEALDTAHNYYRQQLVNTAETIGGLADALLRDKQLLEVWNSQDRTKLLDYCRPAAEQMKTRNRITHFYFHTPDRRCFLRMYKPKVFGDVVDRFTLSEAKRTGKEFWGIELGRYGMFTLRYVRPVVRNDKLLGYLELGTEIDLLLREVQKTTQINFILLVNKSRLNRTDWENGMDHLGRPGRWDQLGNAVITESTFNKVPEEIVQRLQDERQPLAHNRSEIVVDQQTYRIGQMPLVDAAKHSIGEILMFYNINAQKAWSKHLLVLLIGFGLTSSLISILVTGIVLGRIRKRLTESERLIAKEQDALRESEERFRCIATSAQDAILVVDHRGQIAFWSAAATEIFGYAAHEALGREVHALLAPVESASRFRRAFPRFRAPNEAPLNRTVELDARRKNGEIRIFEAALSGVKWKDHWHTIAIFRDVTSRKRDEAALKKAIRQAEAANYAKSHFLTHMSHEIRTPLNVILGFAELLDDDCKGLTPTERHEFLQTIYTSGQHLMNLINDILDLSKIEAEGVEIERRRCSPLQVLAYVLSLLRVRALEKHISLDSDWPVGAPETIDTDPDRLRQLLMHLVGNAVKFTDMGGVRVVAQLVDEEGNQRLAFDVVDTGIGISADQLDTIFNPFVQAENSDSHPRGGTGLGLPIANRIAQALGGKITVVSKPGKGSTFRATIDPGPLDAVRILDVRATDFILTPEPLIPHSDVQFDHARILLIEDGEMNRKMITRVLARAGASVTTAENGHQGVEMALQQPFDLILMDMQMPLMDGYTAAALLRSQGVTMPIIALTAHALKGDKEKCIQAGCSGYLSKPVNVEKLLQAVAANLPSPQSPATGRPTPSGIPTEPLVSTLSFDDPELCEVVTEFVGQIKGKLDAMRCARKNGQWEKLGELAHWLKGAGGTMGFPAFTDPANQLQQQAQLRQEEGVDLLIAELEAVYARIVLPPQPQQISS